MLIKMKKPQLKLIEIIAKNLPEQGQISNINTLVTGKDLIEDVLLAGRKEAEVKGIEPGKDYIIPNVLVMPIDHKGRMKRAFKKLGKVGLINYCKKYSVKASTL